jgi:hypothetical protein
MPWILRVAASTHASSWPFQKICNNWNASAPKEKLIHLSKFCLGTHWQKVSNWMQKCVLFFLQKFATLCKIYQLIELKILQYLYFMSLSDFLFHSILFDIYLYIVRPQPRFFHAVPFGFFSQISSQWESRSRKNQFAFISFGKIQFLPPCIWDLPFMSDRLRDLSLSA